jgi:MFS family permease
VFTWIVPPYARGEIGLEPQRIGLLLLANAFTVGLAQIPVARLAEGHRRAVAMAIAALTFVAACLLVVAAGLAGAPTAFPLLLVASVAVAVGECFHTTALMPLVADLAPPALRGRYMAAIGLSWWLGLALAPTLGTQLLSVSPPATMLAAAGVALAAGLSALALERDLPAAIRLTPRPEPAAFSADSGAPRSRSRAPAATRSGAPPPP